MLRAYDPFAINRVADEILKPADPLIWLKSLLGALPMTLTVPGPVAVGPVAQFCHDMDRTLFLKNDP